MSFIVDAISSAASWVGEATGIDEINFEKQEQEAKESYLKEIEVQRKEAMELMRNADAKERARGRAMMREIESRHREEMLAQKTQAAQKNMAEDEAMKQRLQDIEQQKLQIKSSDKTPTFDRESFIKQRRAAVATPIIRESPETRPGEDSIRRPT